MPTTLTPPSGTDRFLCVITLQGPSGANALGPLIACPTNKNYWATPDGKAIWVGGSHIWFDADQPLNYKNQTGYTTLTFKEFIDRISTYEGANWIRFWAVNQSTIWASNDREQIANMPFAAPNANGQWDLTKFNQTQWAQWRTDIQYAAQKSPPVYIQWQMWPQGSGFLNTSGSPWFNNINGVNPSTTDQLFTDTSGPVWNAMTAYAQQCMDTCHDLWNVVWDPLGNELAGSAANLAWGNAMMSFMRNYEQTNNYMQHPFVFCSSSNGGYSGDNDLWNSTAEGVSPGWGDTVTTGLFGNNSRTGYNTGSPQGTKPGIIDSGHTTLGNASPDQVFCIFTRGWGGFNFEDILDDTQNNSPVSTALSLNQFALPGFGTAYNDTDFQNDAASLTDRQLTRQAIWAARTASLKVNMTNMKPVNANSTTARCLSASDNSQHIVYQPNLGSSFNVTLPAGFNWSVEWVDANTQTVVSGSAIST